MKLIIKEPNPSGAYPGIETREVLTIPDGYYEWPEDLDTTLFYEKRGFVTLTTTKDKVVSYVANEVAYEAYMTEHQELELKVAYEARTVELIRQKYGANDEYKILREYIAQQKTEQFEEYNTYVEQCKQQAHDEIYGGDNRE